MFKYILFLYFFNFNICHSLKKYEKDENNIYNSLYLGIGLNGAINEINHIYQGYNYIASSDFKPAPSIFIGLRHGFKNNFMIGFEFDVNFINLKQSNYFVSSKISNTMNFSGLVGYGFLNKKITSFISFGPSLAFYTATSNYLMMSVSGAIPGLKIGTGLDFKINSNILLRVEYFYNHFWTYFYVNSYNYAGAYSYVSSNPINVESSIHNLRIGISYNFNL